MVKLVDRIKSHANASEQRRIEVPEWGEEGKPLIIVHSMVTLNDLAMAQAAHPNNPLRQSVDILCMKARDEAGQPLFTRMDGADLMESADPAVLNRIIVAMGQRQSSEEIAKN